MSLIIKDYGVMPLSIIKNKDWGDTWIGITHSLWRGSSIVDMDEKIGMAEEFLDPFKENIKLSCSSHQDAIIIFGSTQHEVENIVKGIKNDKGSSVENTKFCMHLPSYGIAGGFEDVPS